MPAVPHEHGRHYTTTTSTGGRGVDGTAEPVVSRRSWLILVAMTGSLSMIMLDQTVVSVALPTMARDLPLSASGTQWIVNAYVLAMAAAVAIGGTARLEARPGHDLPVRRRDVLRRLRAVRSRPGR